MNGEDNIEVIDARIKNLEADIQRLKDQRAKLLEAGVTTSLKITYSLDRKLFYISDSFNMPRGWFGAEKIIAQPEKEKAPFMGGFIQTTLKDGTVYYREYYPFNFWDVKASERDTPITLDDDLAKDFVGYAISEWKWKGYEAVA
jgi:hypothetical protein